MDIIQAAPRVLKERNVSHMSTDDRKTCQHLVWHEQRAIKERDPVPLLDYRLDSRLLLYPLARLLQPFNLAFYQLALNRAHLVEEHDAIAMVCLVQHATRRQFHSIDFEVFAVKILSAHDCSEVALNRREDSRKRQTAFLAVLRAFNPQHLRIDERNALRWILAARAIHYE